VHEALRLVVSTRAAVTDLMTDRSGNVHEFVPDKLGSASWRSMSGLAVDAAWDIVSDRDVWRVQRSPRRLRGPGYPTAAVLFLSTRTLC